MERQKGSQAGQDLELKNSLSALDARWGEGKCLQLFGEGKGETNPNLSWQVGIQPGTNRLTGMPGSWKQYHERGMRKGINSHFKETTNQFQLTA